LPPLPVDILAASFPQYPINTVATGTAVLRVTIDEAGRVAETVPVRRIPVLTSAAVRVLGEWKFKPAEFDETPIRSSVALAFVFHQPLPAPRTNP
jgi:outer membrane biosynthesis protein TonB